MQLDGLFETLIGDPGNHSREPLVHAPGRGSGPVAMAASRSTTRAPRELPVDGQAQRVAVEAAATVQVAGPQQDPAAQNVHATISASP